MKTLIFTLALLSSLLLACGSLVSKEASTAEPFYRAPILTPTVSPHDMVRTIVLHESESPAKSLVVCMPTEPQNLLWTQKTHAARIILDALLEPLIDSRQYEYQANLIEKLPSFEDGDAILKEVIIQEGDTFYDAQSRSHQVLTKGMRQPFGLYQLNGEIKSTLQWDGAPLTTVQMQVRWRLIEELRWQDGRAVSAFDSAFAFEVAQASQLPELKHLTERTASYQAIDERTIEWVSLAGFIDNTYFLNLLTPLPRHLYEGLLASQVTTSTELKRMPLSYGAYKIDDWTKGKYITLSPNDFYVRGKPPLERLTFRFILEPNAVLNKLLAGECDVATHNPAFEDVYERIQPLVEEGRLNMQKVPGLIFEHLDFNLQPVAGYNGAAATLLDQSGSPLLQNVQFRRAVATCLNRRTLVEESTHDSGFIRHSYMSNLHLFYPGDQALTFYPFNPMPGRAMIEQLGYQDSNGDGILEDRAGNKLSLRYSIRTTPQRELIAHRVAAQLRLYCGIETVIEPYNAEFFDDGPEGPIFGRQYDIAQFSWLSGIEAPCYLYMTSQIPTPLNNWVSNNNTGFSNLEFDDACQTALQSLDEEQKAANHAKALAIFTEQLPSIPLLTAAKIILFRPEIEGIYLDATANSELWNIENFDVR